MHDQFEAIHPFLKGLRDRVRPLALLDELFVDPCLTVRSAADTRGVSNPTARQAVSELVRAGALVTDSERNLGSLYVAQPILSILESTAGD